MKVKVEFSETAPLQVKLAENSQTFSGAVSERVNIVDPSATLSHTKLLDLDAPNQHGIPVVTGLQAVLDSKGENYTVITNKQIYDMMKGS